MSPQATQYLVLAAVACAAYYAFGDRLKALIGQAEKKPPAPTDAPVIKDFSVPINPTFESAPDPIQLLRAGIKGHKEKRQKEAEEQELTGLLDELTRFAGGPKKEQPGPNG